MHDRFTTPATPWSTPPGLRPRSVPSAPRLQQLIDTVSELSDLPVDESPPRLLADEVIALFSVIDRLHAQALVRLAKVDAHGVAELEAGTSTASWLRHRSG